MHRTPSLLSHAQGRDPLLQLPRVPGSCHKHVLHTHKNTQEGNQRTQEHLTLSLELRKASLKQELLTPCASPPAGYTAGNGRQVLLTENLPWNHPKAPGLSPAAAAAAVPATAWGWHMQIPSSPRPGQSQGRHGAPQGSPPSEVDVCQTCVKTKRDLGMKGGFILTPPLHQGQIQSIFLAVCELFHFLKPKHKRRGVRKAGNRLGCTFLTLL